MEMARTAGNSDLLRDLANLSLEFHSDEIVDAVIPEPYIPYVPDNWNRILVLAEAQNLSATNSAYVKKLIDFNSEARVYRLYFGSDIGVGPWDDGTLPFALASIWPNVEVQACGVSNACLWSRVHAAKNGNPDEGMIQGSIRLWRAFREILNPRLVVAAGLIAHRVAAEAFLCDRLLLRLPSPRSVSSAAAFFPESVMFERFPEVEAAAKRHAKLLTKYRRNKIFYACHAIASSLNQQGKDELLPAVQQADPVEATPQR